ncbi:MAG: phosphoglucosamine mutase [Candidatus Thorarchaeota archaeon]
MKRKFFGTNGIRGEIGELFTPVFVSKMSSAIAAFMKNKGTMVIGSDSRTSSPAVKYGVISSILSTGIEVIDLGVVPTPLLQFAVTYLKVDFGIMVTASHNPPHFNGIKVVDSDGIEIDIHKQKLIEEIYERDKFDYVSWESSEKVTKIDLIKDYIDRITSFVDVEKIQKRKLTCVVDSGNAVGALTTPLVLKNLGIRVLSINGNLDGHFPGRGVEPIPKKLTLMGRTALQVKADFSIAHDGDADRAIFGDEKGMVYYGDKSIALFQKWLLQNESNKTFVTPVSSSKIVEDISEEIGGKIIWTPVGCIYVSRTMKENDSLLGGEENGGIFYAPHQCVRDGSMAAALMADILAQTDKTFSNLVGDLPQYYQKKDSINCHNKLKEKVMDYVKNNVQEASEILTIDGVKLIYPDSWILIRPSGTEPIFRIFAEAKTKDIAEKMINNGLGLVKKALRNT